MNLTVKADPKTLQDAADIYQKHLEGAKTSDGLMCSFTLQPYAKSLLDKCTTNGGNVLGLDKFDGPLVSVLLLTFWKDRGDDETKILPFMRNALTEIQSMATDRETLVPFIYMNYAFSNQDPIQSYGQANVQKLQAASRKFDPDGLFQKAVPGGWKLGI